MLIDLRQAQFTDFTPALPRYRDGPLTKRGHRARHGLSA